MAGRERLPVVRRWGLRAFAGRAGRPATLGIIGLVLIGINSIAVIVGTLFGPHVIVARASTLDSTGLLSDSGARVHRSRQAGVWSGLSPGLVLRVMASLALGPAGWIVGVVATVTNRGRSFGIAAIALEGSCSSSPPP